MLAGRALQNRAGRPPFRRQPHPRASSARLEVKNGEITQEEFVEFGRKLDRIKNDNEVAYELFAMVMRLDLSGFDKTRLPVTEAKTEQQNETGCKVTAWIERVAKLEFYDPAQQLRGLL